jgi:hypothetical protein
LNEPSKTLENNGIVGFIGWSNKIAYELGFDSIAFKAKTASKASFEYKNDLSPLHIKCPRSMYQCMKWWMEKRSVPRLCNLIQEREKLCKTQAICGFDWCVVAWRRRWLNLQKTGES